MAKHFPQFVTGAPRTGRQWVVMDAPAKTKRGK
jgi:hypothetical protein